MDVDQSDDLITSQNFEFLKKISKMRSIYLRAYQRSMNGELDKDLTAKFKDGDEVMFKEIKQFIIKHLSKYQDKKYCDIINAPDMQEKLAQYYNLDSSYQNKSVKFALLSAEEEIELKSKAIEQLKSKRESMQELVNQTNQLKEDKYNQLNAIFDDLTESICKYDSIGAKEFNKNDLFDD